MVKITLGKLKDQTSDLSEFLQKTGYEVKILGDIIEIGGVEATSTVSSRTIKDCVKKFLYKKGLRKKYRILVNKGEIVFTEIEVEEEES